MSKNVEGTENENKISMTWLLIRMMKLQERVSLVKNSMVKTITKYMSKECVKIQKRSRVDIIFIISCFMFIFFF